MNKLNDDFDLNDPSARARQEGLKGEKTDEPHEAEVHQRNGHREGEFILGIPEPQNPDARPMSGSEKKKYEESDLLEEQERIALLVDQLLKDTSAFRLPESLRKTFMWVAVGIAAVLMLLVTGQVASFLAQMSTMPRLSQWVIGALLLVIVLVILYLVLRLIILYRKLNMNEQINLTAINALSEREELQQLTNQKKAEAIQKLKKYLNDFPIKQQERFLGIGMSGQQFSELKNFHAKLLGGDESDIGRWLESYQSGFQSVLDQTADRCAKAYAIKTSIKTAISPLPMLDNLIVLTLSLSMVRDLMFLYNLRMSTIGAGQILLRAIGQAYIAGELQSLSETFSESLSNVVAEHAGQLTARIGKAVGSKAGEGVANGIMMYRLGKATAKLLRPSSL